MANKKANAPAFGKATSGGFKTAIRKLFPGASSDRRYENGGMPVAPAATITAGPYQDYEAVQRIMNGQSAYGMGPEEGGVAITEMPLGRIARYAIYEIMETDPTINSALTMHITNALTGDPETGSIFSIESKTGNTDDPIIKDLNDTLHKVINENIRDWLYRAACYGIHFIRPYAKQGIGITGIRSDHYTHPRFISQYERGGDIIGYTAAHQNASGDGVRLLDPWKLVPIKIPTSMIRTQEPTRVDMSGGLVEPDISLDDRENESVVESTNYGQSFLATSWGSWFDLQNAIISLNASRHNASRLERIVGVNTGRLDPTKAAEYLNLIAGNLKQSADLRAKRNLLRGFFTTVVNHIMPIFGDGKGRLDINSIEGNPNIEALADITFYIARLCSSLGVDPSLVGFGEQMSGGLGDGGFFRLSIVAAEKSSSIRIASTNMIDRLCDIHVAYKHGKVYLPQDKPWQVVYRSVSSALDREQQENQESRAQLGTLIGQVVQVVDQNFDTADKRTLLNYIFTDVMKVEEEKFDKMFPPGKKPPVDPNDPNADGGGDFGGDGQDGQGGGATGGGQDEVNDAEVAGNAPAKRIPPKKAPDSAVQESALDTELDESLDALVDRLVENRILEKTLAKNKQKNKRGR